MRVSKWIALIACLALPYAARGQALVRVDLRIDTEYEQNVRWTLPPFEESEPPRYGIRVAPGNVLINTEALPNEAPAVRMQLDTDKDGDIADEDIHILYPDTTLLVEVERKWDTGRRRLPYLLTYEQRTGPDSQTRKRYVWRPRYRAEGVLRYGACESFVALLDLNSDGFFDTEDFKRGTSINLDVNVDGEIKGETEWLKGDQIIPFCGNRFLIDELAQDGSYLLLKETALPVPELGKVVPSFTVRTMDGAVLSSEALKGENYLLDFWASWCAPCVAKFPYLKALEQELDGQLKIIAVNVDEPSAMDDAFEVLEAHALPWPHVMNEQGTADPLWKMFGSMEGVRFGIPLYVLVDREGAIRYADTGGAELEILAAAIRDMLEAEH